MIIIALFLREFHSKAFVTLHFTLCISPHGGLCGHPAETWLIASFNDPCGETGSLQQHHHHQQQQQRAESDTKYLNQEIISQKVNM